MRMKNLFEPRYSLLIMIVFIIAIFAVDVITFNYYLRYKTPRLYQAIVPSPLKQITVAHGGQRSKTAYMKQYDFGRDDFTQNIPVWQKVLELFKGKPGLSYLEVGVFEGRSLIWMLENVLTDPNSKATAIDIFYGAYVNKYRANLELTGVSEKVTTIKDYSQLGLRKLPFESFDIIYIDGSHLKNDVLEDAVLSWRLVKPGGLLIFDDYRQVKSYNAGGHVITENPKIAVDGFAQCFDEYFEVIHNEYQLILKRKAK